ncbi:hypothetical protein BOX15_Mlig027511g2 [Macrostomum lignano]|uniref:Sulfhydryl oxidase n=2 Tax=Macrostomum lignano TaxID=282301 RepID=A0A267G7B4_9PLAT|nr:hypothetical protein BOX15_Mlig027511g2 [Macrostomum lignano]
MLSCRRPSGRPYAARFFPLLPLLLLLLLLATAAGPVSAGSGELYSPVDGVTLLDFRQLRAAVFDPGRQRHWLLQVYHAYCGHCIAYSGAFKKLASKLWPWRYTLRIGVINVAKQSNARAMRHFGLSGVPSLLYVAPNCSWASGFSAALPRDTSELPERLLDLMEPFVPQLRPLQLGETADCDFILEEPRPGVLSRGLILEALYIRSLRWRASADSAPAVRLSRVAADGSSAPAGSASDAASLRRLIGLKQPTRPTPTGDTAPSSPMAPRPPTQADLKSALIRALVSDVALAGPGRPRVWRAARDVARLAAPLLPAAGRLAAAMPESLPAALAGEASAAVWQHLLAESGFPEKPPDNWVACAGSRPYFRGYPCGLWQLFHSLTALRLKTGDAVAQPVAPVMRAFIVNCFSCSRCGRNFARESVDLPAEPMPARQELLWLWRLHNRVNRRLAGRPSEDPQHPKVQFPPAALCPRCGDSEDAVVEFLTRWYSATD